jgi:hypothetical protein
MGPEGWKLVEDALSSAGADIKIASSDGRHARRQRFVSITAPAGLDVLHTLTDAGLACEQHDEISRPNQAPETDPTKPLLAWRSITQLGQNIDYLLEDLHANTAL